jgi:hypothetical protein
MAAQAPLAAGRSKSMFQTGAGKAVDVSSSLLHSAQKSLSEEGAAGGAGASAVAETPMAAQAPLAAGRSKSMIQTCAG